MSSSVLAEPLPSELPEQKSRPRHKMWQKQLWVYSNLNGSSRSNSRKRLWAAIDPTGRTLGVHYQLFLLSLPRERGFYSLGSDGARYSKVKLGREFLTKRGFVGQSQFAKPGICYLKHPGFDEQAPRLGQVQPRAGAAAGPLQLLPFPCCPCQYSWRAVAAK